VVGALLLLVAAAIILGVVATVWLRGNPHPTTIGTPSSGSPTQSTTVGPVNTSQVHTPGATQTGPKPPAATPSPRVTGSPTPGQTGPPPPSGSPNPTSS
jgi:hypothetical protein